MPGLILPALCHAVIVATQALGEVVSLSTALTGFAWNEVLRAFDFLGCEPLDEIVMPSEQTALPANIRSGFFRLDTNRALFALMLTDDFRKYEKNSPFGSWPADHLEGVVRSQIAAAVSHHADQLNWPERLFVIVLVRTLGRSVFIRLDRSGVATDDYDFLQLTVPELSVLSLCETGNGIALWKFAQAVRRLEEDTVIICFSRLDLYRAYRKNRRSFYFGDGERPSMVNLDPGLSGEIRREVHRRTDPHFALSLDRQTYHEVVLFRGDRRLPLYAPPHLMNERFSILVEGLPLPIWVATPKGQLASPTLQQIYHSLVDALAFVTWKVGTALVPLLSPLRERYPNLLIELFLPPDENWEMITSTISDIVPEPNTPALDWQIDESWGAVRLVVHHKLMRLAATPDNEGERELARYLVSALAALAHDGHKVDEVTLVGAVERCLPHGPQKMAILPTSRATFLLDDRGLPKYRGIQGADVDEILDELGRHLRVDCGIRRGPIPDEDRCSFLNDRVVSWLFVELQKIFITLSQDSLLIELVGRHEAILREQESLKLTTPTRLACFDFDEGLEGRIHKEMYGADTAAMSHRFLIEYAVAQPPSGTEELSTVKYDRLLALSRHISYYGFASDLVRYGLGDLRFAMLPSGRLDEDREAVDRAWREFAHYFGGQRVRSAERNFSKYWDTTTDENAMVDPDELLAEEDAAMLAEFGFSLQEHAELFHWLVEEGLNAGAVTTMALPILVERFAGAVGWQQKRASELVTLLSLRPRTDFLSPPSGYAKHDLWPWRFNRRVSYLRRPILVQPVDGVEEAVWGTRHCYKAGEYLVQQLTDGRMPPARGKDSSAEMTRYQSRINGERGKQFERAVLAKVSSVDGLTIRGAIKRIGALEVGTAGEIDAIVANATRKTLFVLECKDLSFAKTPYEMGQQITQLFSPDSTRKTAIRQALDKAEWIRIHLGTVLDYMGVRADRKTGQNWKIKPVVVTDGKLMTTSFVSHTVPIVALDDLLPVFKR